MITEGRRHTLTVRGDTPVHFTGYVSFAEPDLTSPDDIDIDDHDHTAATIHDINNSNNNDDEGNGYAISLSYRIISYPHLINLCIV